MASAKAPKKRGMSADEKREKLLEIFHESADVFVLKDIEKLGVKKGINGMMIKEVLQSLVDDDLVRQEKIGISNYFWSFPAEASVKIVNEANKLEADVAAAKKRKSELAAELEREKASRQDVAQQAEMLTALTALRQKVAAAQAELEQYKDNDPETVEAMRRGATVAKDAANRWLDNIHCLMSWSKKQFQGHDEAVNGLFTEAGYKDTIDYIE